MLGPIQTSRGHTIIHFLEAADIDSSQFEIQKVGIKNSLVNQKQNRAFNDWLDHQKSEAEIVDNRNYYF